MNTIEQLEEYFDFEEKHLYKQIHEMKQIIYNLQEEIRIIKDSHDKIYDV